jgi:hypothetical protein
LGFNATIEKETRNVHTLLMPRMSLAGSNPMGSSILFTEKKMELPAMYNGHSSACTMAVGIQTAELARDLA